MKSTIERGGTIAQGDKQKLRGMDGRKDTEAPLINNLTVIQERRLKLVGRQDSAESCQLVKARVQQEPCGR